MAQKNKNDDKLTMLGCLWRALLIYGIIGIIVAIISFIINNFVIFLIILGVVGGTIAITVVLVTIIGNASKRKRDIESERQKNIAIISALEKQPVLYHIPEPFVYKNSEEEMINYIFREYLNRKNDVIKAQTHYDFLTQKASALYALSREEEASQLNIEIDQARTELTEAESKCTQKYKSHVNIIFNMRSDISDAFNVFVSQMPDKDLEIDDFFECNYIKKSGLSDNSALVFTPLYIMHYNAETNTIKLINYKDIAVFSTITTELLKGTKKSTDEIEHIGYLYETKNGFRDMRYSRENNPSFVYIYRGTVTIKNNSIIYEQKFSNRSSTLYFENSLKSYVELLEKKYNDIIQLLLSHDKKILSQNSIINFLSIK